jgi:hypothetical protein
VSYEVKRGDTCGTIARHFYGDEEQVGPIHENNDLGPLPHHLVPGTVLHLPRTATQTSDAKLTFVHNFVDKFTPQRGHARAGEPLKHGERVATEKDASAELVFRDDGRLLLGETTEVVIGGAGDGGEHDVHRAAATLLSGSVRAHAGELVKDRYWAIATAAGRIEMDDGEAQVEVDQGKVTRLSVYSGSSSLAGPHNEVRIAAGYGSMVGPGGEPGAPHQLPPAPVWDRAPPSFVLAQGLGAFQAAYAPGAGRPVSRWHVQIASDDQFRELRMDTKVAGTETTLDVKELPTGRWFVRVSAVDADQFEGPFLEPVLIRIARADLTPGSPGMVRVSLTCAGSGLICGVDDEPLIPRAAPFEVAARGARQLRCASADVPSHPAELSIPAIKLTLSARLARSGPENGVIDVCVHDASGQLLPGLPLVARPQAPLKIGAFKEKEGHYRAEVSWPPHTTRIATDLDVSEDLVGIRFSVKFNSPEGGQ